MQLIKMWRIVQIVWRFSIGAVINYLPLFVASVILLSPVCFSANDSSTYFTGLSNLLYLGDDYVVRLTRNDLFFVLFVAFAAVMVANLLKRYTKASLSLSVRIFCYVLLILTFMVRRFLLWTFDMDITTETLSMFVETNGTESMGFAKTFLFTWQGAKYFVKMLLIAFAIGGAEWLWTTKKCKSILNKRLTKGLMTFVAVLLAPVAVISAIDYPETKGVTGQNTVSCIAAAMKGMKESAEDAGKFYVMTERVARMSDVAECGDDSIDVVLVLGESLIRHHASIYGYGIPTTPCMQRENASGNLVVFSDVMSPFPSTTPSMKNMFCLNNYAKNERWYDSVFWPLLFRKAGYGTYVFDNQRGADKHYNGSFYEMYNVKVARPSFSHVADEAHYFDMEMLSSIRSVAAASEKKTFLFFHLLGQHFPFDNKCPDDEKVFTSRDIKRSELWLTEKMKSYIANHDNAVRHTDKTLGALFELYRYRKAVIVFFSDHGEEVYDYRGRSDRPPMNAGMKRQFALCQHAIPFVVWMSDRYKSAYPEAAMQVLKAKDRPYSHDLIGQMMLHLARIKSPYYRGADDVLSSDYQQSKRVIHVGEMTLDYDSLMQGR